VDLHPIKTPANEVERRAVDGVLGAEPAVDGLPHAVAEVESQRHLLLPALHAVQSRVGWVSPGALGYICRRLGIPPAEGYGVASFYALFALEHRAPRVLHVCDDIACKLRGADALVTALEREDTSLKGTASTWTRSPCLGLCEHAPAALLVAAGEKPVERGFGPVTIDSATEVIATGRAPEAPRTVLHQRGDPSLRLLRRVGDSDPERLDDYRATGGYEALRRAFDLGPTGVIREMHESKLVGRGGAAFPTGKKWEAVSQAPVRPHYVVCNADESEPGTFKDRILMEEDPFAVVEAMTLAGYATASEKGYLYVRGEYPLATERLTHAIREARGRGLLGEDIFGKGIRFDIEIRSGAGAYICGEETALFNSIEGFRGEPRNKPPFPVQVGLFGKPTSVNNVETLVSALEVLAIGGLAYAATGTLGSTGTKLFCLSGNVAHPGLYEVPYGTRLDHLIGLAGGVGEGRKVQAVLLGGAAGAFVTPGELSVPLTFEDTRRIGATLGSGVVMVIDDTISLILLLERMAAFFRDESCGQCVPCRVGTVRQEELVKRLASAHPLASVDNDLALLTELGQVMRDASICGLGQTASSAIESAVKKLKVFQPVESTGAAPHGGGSP
jgi:NADH-quinone oxidoreductase subunit F